MLAGALRHRITIQSNTPTISASGSRTDSWGSFAADVPADVQPIRGREYVEIRAAQSAVTTRFVIRYLPGVTSGMRVVWGGVSYDIDEVIDVGARNRTLEIMAAPTPK